MNIDITFLFLTDNPQMADVKLKKEMCLFILNAHHQHTNVYM